MKLLRDILALCVSVVVMLAVASCSGHSDRPGLVALDSLILQDPDSACELLAAYPADSLPTADDRAYYALLTTIADYKAYRPATTDSVINIALNHYDHNGANQDHRMRSYLYAGCIMEVLGDAKAAMKYYKKAQYSCSNNDNFHKGYIHFRIASLFQDYLKFQEATTHYKSVLTYMSDNNNFVLSSYDNLGLLYIANEIDSAFKYINLCMLMAQRSNDTLMICKKYSDLASAFYSKGDYERAKHSSVKVIESLSEPVFFDAYFTASESYLKLSKLDSAKYYISIAPIPTSRADSLQLYSCLAEI